MLLLLVDCGEERYFSAVATTVDKMRKLAEEGWTYFQESVMESKSSESQDES